jgi:hypothetical protein
LENIHGRPAEALAVAALEGQIEFDEMVEMLRQEYKEIRDSHGNSRDPTVKLHKEIG